MVVDSHPERDIQSTGLEAEALIPFRIQVPVNDCTAILEATTLELHIRIAAT